MSTDLVNTKYSEVMNKEELLPLAVQMATAEKTSVDLDGVRAAIATLTREVEKRNG